MKTAQYWIDHLELSKHPEGGYYRETYRSSEHVGASALPDRFNGDRKFSTSIYFLLPSADRSMYHRIKSDELWYYHAGSSLTLFVLSSRGLEKFKLGPDLDRGESLQVVIPAGCWFGALVNEQNSYTLSGCSVSPGFDFQDFELADRDTLTNQFPSEVESIQLLTKG